MQERENLFQNIPADEREVHLTEGAYKAEIMDLNKPFSADELTQFKDDLSEDMIELNAVRCELDEIKAEYKAKMKPLEDKVKIHLRRLKDKYELVEEKIFMYDDQATGEMIYYDRFGMYVQSRKLMPQERQTKIVNFKQSKTA